MRVNRERGAVALEFALILPVTLLLLFGLMYTGFYSFVAASAQNAAREAARYASVPSRHSWNPDYPTDTEITDHARDAVPSWARGDVAIDVSDAGSERPGSVVTVTVSYSEIPLFGALSGLLGNVGLDGATGITRAATGRRE